MIRHESNGYNVYSEEGKHLGGPYTTREEADKRLKEVEYFKSHKKDEAEKPSVVRYDMGRLDKANRTPQGGLRVDAIVTRTGVFNYRNQDGSVRRELRHPDHVFKADSLASLEDAPLTYLHPRKVDPSNYKALSIGHVRNARQDGQHVATVAIIQDQKSISGVERGDLVEVSCGYNCDMLETPGEYNGEKYDAVQTNIVYNHVAIGPKNWGRGGHSVRLRLDSGDAIVDGIETSSEDEREDNVEHITINGVQYEVGSKQHVQVLTNMLASEKSRADAAEASLQAATGRADGLQGKLDQAAKDLADAKNPDTLAKAVKARVAIEAKAATIVGPATKFDGLPDREVMAQAISKKDSSFVLTAEHSVEYLQGRFDSLVASAPTTTSDKIAAGIDAARAASAEKADAKTEAPKPPPNMSERYYSQPFGLTK